MSQRVAYPDPLPRLLAHSSLTCGHALKQHARPATPGAPAHWQGLDTPLFPRAVSGDGNTVVGCGWVGAAPRGRWRITQGDSGSSYSGLRLVR